MPRTADLSAVIKNARNAQPTNAILRGEGTNQERVHRVPFASSKAGSTGTLGLRELVPTIPDDDPTAVTGPTRYNRPAGQQETLSATIAQSSRVIQAGGRLIPVDTPPADGELSWTRAGAFNVITGGNFAQGDENNPLTAQQLPYTSEDINMDNLEQYGLRIELSRKEMKHDFPGAMNARVVNAITHGLTELVDRVALQKLEAEMLEANGGSSLPAFSLAAAASKKLRFGELAAIVGTDGTGAQYDDGRLRVSGVPAELTGEHAQTFIGAFDRCAVAIWDDIRVLVERLNVDGSVAITCWVDLMALAPDAGYFWSAS